MVRSTEISLQKMLKILQIADLAGDLEAFTICCATVIETFHCLNRMVYSIMEE